MTASGSTGTPGNFPISAVSLDVLREKGWEPVDSNNPGETVSQSTETALYAAVEALLTPREREVVLAQLGTGTRKETAELLGTSPDNVRVLLQHIRRRVLPLVGRTSTGGIYVKPVSDT